MFSLFKEIKEEGKSAFAGLHENAFYTVLKVF